MPTLNELRNWSDRRFADAAAKVVYIIEATSYEQLALWKDFKDLVNWKEVTRGGPVPCVGYLDDRPIHITMDIASIHGQHVLFYDPSSQVVDHEQVDAYLAKQWPGVRKTDAMNFHNCAHHCKALTERQ